MAGRKILIPAIGNVMVMTVLTITDKTAGSALADRLNDAVQRCKFGPGNALIGIFLK